MRKAAAWALHGAQVWTLGAADDGRVPLELLLKRLGAAGYLHVLCEGGGHLALSLLEAGLVDDFRLHLAPMILGDEDALPLFSGRAPLSLEDALRMRVSNTHLCGEDIHIHLRPLEAAKA